MKQPTSKVEELREALKAKKEAETKIPPTPPLKKGGTPASPPFEKGGEGGFEAPQSESAREAEDLLANIRAAEEDAKKHYDKLLRVMAEFENFKKRVSREHEEKTKFANENLIIEILPVLDDFDRVLDHISEDASQEVKAIADGVNLIRRALFGTLSKFGLSEIDALGKPFDPTGHEAVSCIESNEHDENSVISVHRKGYKLEDRVIRAAQVIVTKKGNQTTDEHR